MIDEITGKEITEPCKILFVDYRNWNIGMYHKNISLEEINKRCDNDFTEMPKIVVINKPKNE